MPINVSEVIDMDTAEVLAITRAAAGEYVDGIYVKGVPATFSALVSAQNPSPKEVQMLPEGERQKDIKKFISKTELFIDNDRTNTLADTITYRGAQYKLMSCSDYQSYGYTRAFGARIE